MFGLTGIWRFIVPGVAALALIAVIILGVNSCKKTDQENYNTTVNTGVVQEREKSQGETLNAIDKANNAVERPTSDQLNVVCSKYDRNCKNTA